MWALRKPLILESNKDMSYDWIVIGGGISGISTAEILTREGHSVLLLEKNDSLASETSKVFHEWLHTLLQSDIYVYLFGTTLKRLKYNKLLKS